jgi:hypothetical protein
MAISAQDLAAIDDMLRAAAGADETLPLMRASFGQFRWLACDADDVTEAPYRSYPRFDLHLLDAAGHCVHLTSDATQASGIVLARRRAA